MKTRTVKIINIIQGNCRKIIKTAEVFPNIPTSTTIFWLAINLALPKIKLLILETSRRALIFMPLLLRFTRISLH